MNSARVGGALSFSAAQLAPLDGRESNHRKKDSFVSISAKAIRIGGPLYVNRDAKIYGNMAFAYARIAGLADFTLLQPQGPAGQSRWIDLSQSTVGADVLIGQQHKSTDLEAPDAQSNLRFNLERAEIGGQLAIYAAHAVSLDNKHLIDAEGARIHGGVDGDRSILAGSLKLHSAQIGGKVALTQSEVSNQHGENQSGRCIDLAEATVNGDVEIGSCTFDGSIRASQLTARDFTIGGCASAKDTPRDSNRKALDLKRATLSGRLALWAYPLQTNIAARGDGAPVGAVDLSNVRCAEFDDEDAFWAHSRDNDFNGFEYKTLGESALARTISQRRKWLASQAKGREFRAQPYLQLSKILRLMGRERDARRIAEDAARLRRPRWWSVARVFHWLYGLTAGHGYRLGRAGFVLLVLYAAALWIAAEGWRAGAYAPTDQDVLGSDAWKKCAMTAEEQTTVECWARTPADDGGGASYERFDSAYYAADVLIPLVDLDKEDRWTPISSPAPMREDGHLAWAIDQASRLSGLSLPSPVGMDMAWIARYTEPFITLLGWLLSAFIALGLSRSIVPR